MNSPTKRTTKQLKDWITDAPERSHSPLQFSETSAAFKILDDEGDLISLHPPGDDDNGTKIVAELSRYVLLLVRLSILNLPEK